MIICFKQLRLLLQLDLVYQLGDVVGNNFNFFRRPLRKSVCSVGKRLYAVLLYCFENGKVSLHPIFFRVFYVLIIFQSALDDSVNDKRFNKRPDYEDYFSCLGRLLYSLFCSLPVFLFFSVAYLRIYSVPQWVWKRKRSWKRSYESSIFFQYRRLCLIFFIFARIKFETVRAKRDDFRARLMNISIKKEKLVHYSTLRSDMSARRRPFIARLQIQLPG